MFYEGDDCNFGVTYDEVVAALGVGVGYFIDAVNIDYGNVPHPLVIRVLPNEDPPLG